MCLQTEPHNTNGTAEENDASREEMPIWDRARLAKEVSI